MREYPETWDETTRRPQVSEMCGLASFELFLEKYRVFFVNVCFFLFFLVHSCGFIGLSHRKVGPAQHQPLKARYT